MQITISSGTVLSSERQMPAGFLQIQVPPDGAILRFKIVEHGTDRAVALPNVHFTVLDIDGSPNRNTDRYYGDPVLGLEQLKVCSPHHAVLTQSTTLTKDTDGGQCKTYTSTVGGALDNQPLTDGTVHQKQQDMSAELVFNKMSELEMGYSVVRVTGDKVTYRTMLITSNAKITDCAPGTR